MESQRLPDGSRSVGEIPHDGERMIPALDRGAMFYGEHVARYQFACRLTEGRRILDVACGAGYGSDLMKAAGAAEVIGVDVSELAVFYAQEHHASSRPDYLSGDATALPLRDSSIDVVVSFETIEHVEDHRLFLSEVQRVLRADGLLIVSTPNKSVYPEGNPFHLKEFDFGEFKAALESSFAYVEILCQDNWITNAILPAAASEGALESLGGNVAVNKVSERRAEGTLYMVALCSDAPLPSVSPQLTLSSVSDMEHVMKELARRDMEIERATHDLAARGTALRQSDTALRERENQLQDAIGQLDAIRYSTGYRLLERLRTVLRRLFPAGSRRGIPYQAFMLMVRFMAPRDRITSLSRRRRLARLPGRAIRVVRREGWRALLVKIKRRLTGGSFGSRLTQPGMVEEFGPLSFPESKEPLVSIVIPVFNKALYTFNCLLTVLQKSGDVPYEVIVVDDASSDDTQEMLSRIENIQTVTHPRNLGFVHSCNDGARAARGKYVLFLNNDTQVHEGWLSALVDTAESDDAVGIVGGRLIYPDGRLQEAGGIVWRDATAWNFGRLDDPEKPEYNYVRDVDYCTGACILVRRDLFQQVGGFDLRYAPAYYEETDLAFTFRSLGYRVVYQPASVVTHYEGVTAGTDTGSGMKRYQEINRHKFREKWQAILDSQHLPNARDVMRARDRRSGDRILVVDYAVPAYDRDAGSLRMFEMLRILVEMGLVITFLPDNMARAEPYTRLLQQMGIEVLYGPKDVNEHLSALGPHLKAAIVSRPDVAATYVPMIRKRAPDAAIIYDTVDLHFVREERRAEVEESETARRSAHRYRQMELALAAGSDATITVTDVEREVLLEAVPGLNVHVVPTIHGPTDGAGRIDGRKDILFVGSFLHPPNVDAAIFLADTVFPIIRKQIDGVQLLLVGSEPGPTVKALARKDVIVTGWVEDIAPYFTGARVFVAPLRYGAGLKGKIGQAMSFGLPVVTTSLGVEGMDVVDGREVMVADDPEEFATKAVALYRDDVLWNQISMRALSFSQENYSPAQVGQRLSALLLELGVQCAPVRETNRADSALARV